MVNRLSMLAAHRVAFNSTYHLEAWFEELSRFLLHFTDHKHLHHLPGVRARSGVLPVGCDLARLEYDKAPEVFFRALDALAGERVPFRVALAGRNVRQKAQEFEAARRRLGERVIHYGWADAATDARLLWRSDVVVSTALHEFFGIAVVEAIYCGCFPVLPRRFASPEVLPSSHHALCLYDDLDGLLERLRWPLTHPEEARRAAQGLREGVAQYDWSAIAPRYDALIEATARAGLSP